MLRHLFILFAVSTVVVVAQANCDDNTEIPEEYKNSDGCWVASTRTFVPTGTVVPNPERCEGYRCIPQENGLAAVTETCGTVATKPPCYEERDDTLSYPDCCPTIKCPAQTQDIY